jgi:hypothetical protein
MKRRRSSLTDQRFHGISTSQSEPGGITHGPGTECRLRLGPDTIDLGRVGQMHRWGLRHCRVHAGAG